MILQLALNPQVSTSQQVLNMQRLPFDQGRTASSKFEEMREEEAGWGGNLGIVN